MSASDHRPLLAFEADAGGCSAAVTTGEAVLAFERLEGPKLGDALIPLIDRVVAAAGLQPPDLAAVAVAKGPGSFTGVRAAVAAARGLALALGVPAVGVGTLEALERAARRAGVAGPLVAVLDGRRGEVFAQNFDAAGEALGGPGAWLPAELAERVASGAVLVGTGAALVAEAIGKGFANTVRVEIKPDARDVAGRVRQESPNVLLRQDAFNGAPVVACDLSPLYLRPPDARPSAGRSLLAPLGAPGS